MAQIFLLSRSRRSRPPEINDKVKSSFYCYFHNSLLAILHPSQRLRKICAQILGGLNAARHSHQAVGYAYGR